MINQTNFRHLMEVGFFDLRLVCVQFAVGCYDIKMKLSKKEDYYRAFLLRIWRVGKSRSVSSRASLENVHTGEKYIFTNSRDMLAYLERTIEDAQIAAEEYDNDLSDTADPYDYPV